MKKRSVTRILSIWAGALLCACAEPSGEDDRGAGDVSSGAAVMPSAEAAQFLEALAANSQIRLFKHDVADGPAFEQHENGLFARRVSEQGLKAMLPNDASEDVRLSDPVSGMTAAFRLRDAAASWAKVSGSAVWYPAAFAEKNDVIVQVTPYGVEDHIVFEEAPNENRVVYLLSLGDEVAGLRLVHNSLELLDKGGAPRLRVMPPRLIDAEQEIHGAELAVVGCDVDTSFAFPWGRPVTDPGSRTCEIEVSWSNDGMVYPAVLDPEWTSAGLNRYTHDHHEALKLPDGRVIVAGGFDEPSPDLSNRRFRAEAEVYDPSTETWAVVDHMHYRRSTTPLIQLNDGRVLMAAGLKTPGPGVQADIFDPSTGTWTTTPRMNEARQYPGVVKLADGRVLVTGGSDGPMPEVRDPINPPNVSASAEIYDPVTDTWTAVGNMLHSRANHGVTLLSDGRVWITSGLTDDGRVTDTTEFFDPSTETFSLGSDIGSGGWGHHQYHFRGGIAILGRTTASSGTPTTSNNVLIYDPDTGSWTAFDTFGVRQKFASVVRNDILYVIGSGIEPGAPTTVDVLTGGWFPGGPALDEVRRAHSATLLDDGSILVVGGLADSNGWPHRHSFRYIPDTCSKQSDCPDECIGGTCCPTPVCGNGVCEAGEASCSCEEDCGPDSDGDGLADEWEINGIPASCGGIPSLDLPALGADPNHKDIFLEIDYMVDGSDSREPHQIWLDDAVQFFEEAPVDNPDGTTGIRLHIFVDEAIEMVHRVCINNPPDEPDVVGMATIMQDHFDSNRWSAFHYAVYGDANCQGNWLARGLLFGNRIFLGTRDFRMNDPDYIEDKRTTLIHELGHNLNLYHGGDEEVNNKPNYVSIMNYRYIGGFDTPIETGVFSFSREALPPLDENDLNEVLGVGTDDVHITHMCAGNSRTPSPGRPVDWNCNGDPTETNIGPKDINGDGDRTILTGYNDYANLRFDFQCGPGHLRYGEPPNIHIEPSPEEEPDQDIEMRTVDIDIAPQCDENPVDLMGDLAIAVAVFSEADLDLSAQEPAVFTLQDASPVASAIEDANNDGLLDLILYFDPADLALVPSSIFATLTGNLSDTLRIMGQDGLTVQDTQDSDDDGVADVCDQCANTPDGGSDPIDLVGCTAEQLPPRCSFHPVVDCAGVALFASKQLILHDRVVAVDTNGDGAAVVNGGSAQTVLGNDAATGEVWSKASCELRHRVSVDGSIRTNGEVSYQYEPNVTISGDVLEHQSLVIENLSDVSVAFPSFDDGQSVDVDQSAPLAAGAYAYLDLRDRSEVILEAGDYFLGRLHVGSNADLILPSQGLVRVFVQDQMGYYGSVDSSAGGSLQLFYMGANGVVLEKDFDGMLIAPNAALTLATDHDEYQGAFFAKQLELRPDVTVRLQTIIGPTLP